MGRAIRRGVAANSTRGCELGCGLLRTADSHRHYSNPFRPDRLITFTWHTGDVPRGIIADITDDLGLTRDEFYFKKV